jgi:GntR family transcriptional regulator
MAWSVWFTRYQARHTMFMRLDRTAPEPLYQQLASLIRVQIESGRLRPRTAIPSIEVLAAEHGVSAVTVKQAIDVLKREGLVHGVPGKGTFVSEP